MKDELFKLEIMLNGFPSKIKEEIIKGKKAKKLHQTFKTEVTINFNHHEKMFASA